MGLLILPLGNQPLLLIVAGQVPIGKHAFFPGQLVHTNEIMVLLGDNHFIERSVRQADGIADRRLASKVARANQFAYSAMGAVA